jgi:DNA-binding transcriptional MerR regulator
VSYSVGQVAELATVTVRTLHHYDQIGLLSPSERSTAGYRRYSEPDLERLQRILFYRELGFSLETIANILDDPGADAAEHLRRQYKLLTEQLVRVQAMVAAVESAMEARKMGISLTPEEQFEVFGEFTPADHAEEAEQRWGDTDAWKESQRRTAAYTKEDWLRIKADGDALSRRLAAAFTSGVAADSEAGMDLAEEHRQGISQTFYDCTYEAHRGLGDMYLADDRFARNYEPLAPGLTQWLRDAIHANADRAEAG